MRQTLHTADLASAPDRFSVWQSMVAREAMPAKVRSPHTDDFTATLQMVSLGPATLLAMEHPRLEVERTASHIRQGDPEAYVFILNLAGHQRVDQDRRTALIQPGDFTMYHSSRPMRTFSDPTLRREAAVVVAIPEQAMPMPADRLRPLLATRMPGDQGVGAVVAAYLRALSTAGGSSPWFDADRLAHVTLDLIAVLLAEHADAPGSAAIESRQRAQFARIEAFVLRRLDDLTLTPSAVAAAHHMSLRSLQRLFQAEGASVAGMIRDGRLRRCRRDLGDPALADYPIATLARRWGFDDPASFSRAFKRAFGRSPAEHRADACVTGQRPPSTP